MALVIWQGDVDTDPTTAGNWSTAAVPQAGDDVLFDGSASGNCAGGDVSANLVQSITVTSNCTIDIGTSLEVPIDFDCAGPLIDSGSGTRFWKVENTTAWECYGTGECHIDGIDNDGLVINASAATIWVGENPVVPAEFGDQVSVVAGTINILYLTDQAAAAPDLIVRGGVVVTQDALAAVEQYGGRWHHRGFGQVVASATIHAGTAHYETTGTLTAGFVYAAGTLTFENNVDGCIVTNCTVEGGGKLLDPNGVVTWTNPVAVTGTSVKSGAIDFGSNKTYDIADI